MKGSGNHPCYGGCGKAVSASMDRCMDCVVRLVVADLTAREVDTSEEEVRRAISQLHNQGY